MSLPTAALLSATVDWDLSKTDTSPSSQPLSSASFTDSAGLVRWELVIDRGSSSRFACAHLFLKHLGPPLPAGSELRFSCEASLFRDSAKATGDSWGWASTDRVESAKSGTLRHEDNAQESFVGERCFVAYFVRGTGRVRASVRYEAPRRLAQDRRQASARLALKTPRQFEAAKGPDLREPGPMLFADARLAIRGARGPATLVHKAILAQSPVFVAMMEFTDGEGPIELDGFTADILQGLVDFLYTGQASGLTDNAEQLLEIGERFQLPGLCEQAETALWYALSPVQVAETYRRAVMVSSDALKAVTDIAACERALGSANASEVLGSEALFDDFPDLAISLARAVLAQSPVFERMLESELEEGQTSCIALDGITSEALSGLIDFLYAGQASGLKDAAGELLNLGEQYQLPALKEQAAEALSEGLDAGSLADVYRQAETMGQDTLKAACERALLRSEAWEVAGLEALLRDFPDLSLAFALSRI